MHFVKAMFIKYNLIMFFINYHFKVIVNSSEIAIWAKITSATNVFYLMPW